MRSTLLLLATAAAAFASAQNVPDGPDAPDMNVAYEAGTGFIFTLNNPIGSNNQMEGYVEAIVPPGTSPDPYWRFQGYVIYQFANATTADDSLHAVINDPIRARPLLAVDITDAVNQAVDNLDPTGPLDCVTMTWTLINLGIPPQMYAFMDPFVQQPYDPDQEYCFAAVAFATNPYHHSVECDTLQQVLKSKKAAFGTLGRQCVVGGQVGAEEQGMDHLAFGPVPATDELRIIGTSMVRYNLRCVSSLGALVHDGAFVGNGSVDVGAWPAGIYHATVLDGEGRGMTRSFMVMHE